MAALLAPAGILARARRWRYLFPPRLAPPALVPAMMIGYMANNVLPLRAGEVVRVYVVAHRWGHGFWLALATLVVERVIDSLSIVLILATLVLLVPVPPIFQHAAVILVLIDVVGIAVLAVLALAPAAGRRAVARLARRWPRLEPRVLGIYDTFARGVDGVRTPAHIGPVLGWNAVAWTLAALAAWTSLRAVNIELPFLAGWTVLAFVGLGVSVPSAPGYIGVFPWAAILGAGLFGVSRADATAFALVFHASQFVPVTLLGWIYLVREHVTLTEATHAPAPIEDGAA